uniref:Cobalt-precorrin 5A hydrolase n=1 Tax=Candidatus Kentrum sp. DK TaxID=2126562 RepID=A0A450SXD1_9GAMM|nr:MAG: cobalt-precorrin 5A hydrolase [Candidatus Kentron sp. DK]
MRSTGTARARWCAACLFIPVPEPNSVIQGSMVGNTKIIIGIGCDRGASMQTLEDALNAALAAACRTREAIVSLATIDRKRDEPGLVALSGRQGWPLVCYTAEQLARVKVPNPSETVRRHMGTPAVSEAAALLAAGGALEHLLLEKYKFRGGDGKNVTVSIAALPEDKKRTFRISG